MAPESEETKTRTRRRSDSSALPVRRVRFWMSVAVFVILTVPLGNLWTSTAERWQLEPWIREAGQIVLVVVALAVSHRVDREPHEPGS